MIKEKCEEIEKRIEEFTILKNRLKLYVQPVNCKEQGLIEIQVKEIPQSYVAYSRYRGLCTPDEFYLRYTKLSKLIEISGLHMSGTMMAIYYDDYRTFDYTNADIEVCVTIGEGQELEGIVRKFGGFLAVTTVHYGSYKTMNQTYGKLLQWLEKNDFTLLKITAAA